ncbi:hypothetical protein ACJIZ3_018425 [Penstemon smallii]|uniref:Transmembrane protein n=1 Tax=Penstemon smallii TaxID=265156 RepID=A0ABD3SZP1_9LAMI
MLGSGMNLITTIIGFGMSATFIVFVCTRLICGRLRRMDDPQMFEIDTRIDLELQPENRINGLAPVVVAAIPTMKFNREAFGSMEDAHSEITLEHSQQWLLPTVARAEANESYLTNADSISIEVETGVSREATLRASS